MHASSKLGFIFAQAGASLYDAASNGPIVSKVVPFLGLTVTVYVVFRLVRKKRV